MYETPEVEKMDSKTGPVPVVVNFAAVVDNVVAAVYDAGRPRMVKRSRC